MTQPLQAPTGDYDGYTAAESEQLCNVCKFHGPTDILPKLTPAERNDMPMPLDTDVCSRCGMRRAANNHR